MTGFDDSGRKEVLTDAKPLMLRHDKVHRSHALRIFLAGAFLYTFTASGYVWQEDGATRLEVAKNIAFEKSWSISPNWPSRYLVQGKDGRWYSFYGIGQTVAFLPFVFLGKGVHSLGIGPSLGDSIEFFASFVNVLWGSAAVAIYYLLVLRFGYRERTAVLLAAALGLGTIFWPHTREHYDHLQVSFFLLLSSYLIAAPRPFRLHHGLSGAALGAAFLTRADSLLFLPCLVLISMIDNSSQPLQEKLRRIVPFLSGFMPFLVVVALYNYLRFESVWETGYGLGISRAHYNFLQGELGSGLYRMLASPGLGLFPFNPVLLLGLVSLPLLWIRSKRQFFLIATVVVTYSVFFAKLDWFMLGTWGPRHLIPVIPFGGGCWSLQYTARIGCIVCQSSVWQGCFYSS